MVSALTLAAGAPASGKEGVMEWRFVKNEGQLSLYIADTDGGADTILSPSFKCEKGDNEITIRGVMTEKLRRAYADGIVKQKYPRAELAGDGKDDVHFMDPVYSEKDRWMYMLRMGIGAAGLASFRKTGMLGFKFNGAAVEQGNKAGLDKIGEFFETCRRGTW
jgi:hypothetical protein